MLNKQDLIFIDIGANIGLVSLYVLPICKKIIAYEPSPNHYSKLQFLSQNTLIETRQTALSNIVGMTPLLK